MSNLILFTNRSGSTVLCDILSYAHNTVNLGEGLHSLIREYNYNTPEHKETKIFRALASSNLTRDYHNMRTRGSDYIGFYNEKAKRINFLKNAQYQWTIKEQVEKQTIDIDIINHCINNGIDVYMTHRRDIVAQFISKINARYRLEVAQFGNNQFIFTNNDSYRTYDTINVEFRWLHLYLNVFLSQLMLWRSLYEIYKPHVKLVSYEDQIKPMNFEAIGISKDVVEKYRQEKQHLVPTPFNTNKIIVTDDHPKPMVGAWEQSLYYIEKHKYLVEI